MTGQQPPSQNWRSAPRQFCAALHGLTAQGRSVLAAGLVVAAFSPLLGEKGLFRIAALLIALPLLAAVAVSATRSSMWCHRSLQPTRVQAGQPARVRLRLTTNRRSLGLRLEDTVPAVLMPTDPVTGSAHRTPAVDGTEIAGSRFQIARSDAGETTELEHHVLPRQRGHYVLGPLTVQRGDPFGMCTLLQPVSGTQTLIVTPTVTALPTNPLIDGRAGLGEHRGHTLGAYGDDAAAVRSYQPGDDPRRVHWRSTARAGELMVRQQEQPRHARATVLLDTRAAAHTAPAGSADTAPANPYADSFEWAVNATASITAHLIDQGMRVRLLTDTGHQITTGESIAADTPTAEKNLQIMEFLAGVTRSDRRDLTDGFATQTTTRVRDWEGDPGVIIAVLGALGSDDAAWLGRSRGGLGDRAELTVALVLDEPSWSRSDLGDWFPGMATSASAGRSRAASHGQTVTTIPSWGVVGVPRGGDIAALWRSLARSASQSGGTVT